MCSQKCSCDCGTFQEVQAQLEAREKRTAPQGAVTKTPTNQTRRSQWHRETKLGGRGGSRGLTGAHAGWKYSPQNPQLHDEAAAQTQAQAQASALPARAITITVREIYRPIALVDGRRVEGDRVVQQIQLNNASVPVRDTPAAEADKTVQRTSPQPTSNSGLGLLIDIGDSHTQDQATTNTAPVVIPGITRNPNALAILTEHALEKAEEEEDLIQF